MTKLIDAIQQFNVAKEERTAAIKAAALAKSDLWNAQANCLNKAKENLEHTPLYKSLVQTVDTTYTLAKKLEENYELMTWTRDGDHDDYISPYPETKEYLEPYVKELRELEVNAQTQIKALIDTEESHIYNDMVDSYQKQYEEATKTADDCVERYKRSLEQLKWGCPELIVNGTNIDKIAEVIQTVERTYHQEEEFYATESSITLTGSYQTQISVELGDDEGYLDASDIPGLELDQLVDKECETICNKLQEAFSQYDFEVTYDICDQEYSGDRAHMESHYDEDWGFSSGGDYYVGEVINSATISLEITITKEV